MLELLERLVSSAREYKCNKIAIGCVAINGGEESSREESSEWTAMQSVGIEQPV